MLLSVSKKQSNSPGLLGGSGSYGTEKNRTNTPRIADEVELDARIVCGLYWEAGHVRYYHENLQP